MFQILEIIFLLQGIRNISDCEQLQHTLNINEHFFKTEFKKKEKLLLKNLCQTSKEMAENNELLENLKKQHFAKNKKKATGYHSTN